jgi:hypothetical protein
MESVPALARPLTFEWRSPHFSDTSFYCKSQTDIGGPPTKSIDKIWTINCGRPPLSDETVFNPTEEQQA